MTKVKDMKATKYTKETLTQIGIADRGFPDFQIGDAIAVSQRIKERAIKSVYKFLKVTLLQCIIMALQALLP